MSKPLSGKKIAFLASNGFNESDLTALQRALMQAGSPFKIVSPDVGLVNGWAGQGFGHHYPVDVTLATALGVDYDMLVIPGGARSLDKLEQTAHTKRFVGSMASLGRPIVVFEDAVRILAKTDILKGRSVAAPISLHALVEQAGADISDENMSFDGNISAIHNVTDESRQEIVAAIVDFFVSHATMAKAA